MKVRKAKVGKASVSEEDLIYQCLPAGYLDSYMCDFECNCDITADDVQVGIWTDFPPWLRGMFKLRNFLVKPFKLKSGGSAGWDENTIKAIRQGEGSGGFGRVFCKSEDETIIYYEDKHLDLYFSTRVMILNNDCRRIKATTLVKFHNWLGRVYFAVIFLFHRFIVKSTLKRVIRKFSQ